MSARRRPADDPAANDTERWAKDADLHERVVRDMIARDDAYRDVPAGCTLVLVPDDDPAQTEWAIRQGAEAARRGASVYLRRVVVAVLPTMPSVSDGDPIGSRRIDYEADGTVRRVTVREANGTWREVEPTAEDAAGLPPLPHAEPD
ncbi:MAG: hypothetical protein H0W06_09120 [Chloroflexia bacterium]|nr:hypothetical protein [Chloroflexia bacterium]